MVSREAMPQKGSCYASAFINGHRQQTPFLPQELLVISNETVQQIILYRANRGRNRAAFAQMFKQLLQHKRIAAEMVSPLPPFKKRVRLPFIQLTRTKLMLCQPLIECRCQAQYPLAIQSAIPLLREQRRKALQVRAQWP
jgi:hypothetical protein